MELGEMPDSAPSSFASFNVLLPLYYILCQIVGYFNLFSRHIFILNNEVRMLFDNSPLQVLYLLEL